jgi:asparagine N-glycosylation enzyme membrane subunit Stt3
MLWRAVLFCVLQALIAYFFGKELKDSGSGLVASALMAVVPGLQELPQI